MPINLPPFLQVDLSNTNIDGDLVSDPFLVCSESLEKIVLKGCVKLTGGEMLENLSPFGVLRYFSIAGSKGLTHLIDVNFIPVRDAMVSTSS